MFVRYFYASILAFATGIFVRSLLSLHISLLLLIGAVFIFGVGWQYWLRESVVVAVIVCSFFLLAGALRTDYALSQVGTSPLARSVGEKVELVGAVVREPEQRERVLQLYVQTDTDIILVQADRYETVQYGDVVKVSGKLKKPEAFVTDLGRTFNYPGYLLARGVEYTISFPKLAVVEAGKGNSIVRYLLTAKTLFISALSQVLPEPQLGLGIGLLLGVQQGLGAELEAAFRSSGIIHIVVLSGYNITLVVVFVGLLLSFIFSPRPRVVAGLCTIVAFAVVVGFSATVVRACIMAALCLIAQTMGRTYEVLRALLFAGAVMLLINPYLLVYDVGFQLSFLATLGLILVAPPLVTLLAKVPLWAPPKEFLISTIATQITVLPLLLYQVGQCSVVAVLVNVLVLPVVPLAMLLTFLEGLLALVSPVLATLVVYPTYVSLSYIIGLAQFFAHLPFASFTVPTFPFWLVLLSYALMGYWWYRVVSKTDEVEIVSLSDWEIDEEMSRIKE